jgi:hypothetical protein
MSTERRRILDLLATGKVSPEEAEQLLDALKEPRGGNGGGGQGQARKDAKFMYVKVTSEQNDNVDVKVPLGLIRAGMKLTALIPPQAMQHINSSMAQHGMAIDLANLKTDDIEELVQSLTETEVNVNSKNGDNVRVYCA